MGKDILKLVMSTKEASDKYNIADCTIRTWADQAILSKSEVKKSGNAWIVTKPGLERVLKQKGMFGKEFSLGGDDFYMKHLAHKGEIEIWYQNDKVKELIDEMPYKSMIPQIFEIFRKEQGMNFKFMIIDDNLDKSDNWYFKKEKVWAITLRGVLETMRDVMVRQGIENYKLDIYLNEKEITI